MLVVADENMPHAVDFFSRFGEVRLVPGRGMTPATVRDAELLMVRSVTRVNRALLEGSKVKFVGTATIGTDHVDLDYLQSCAIAFSAAPGCNAESVAQYMAAALAWSAGRKGWRLSERSIGIVGVGNCGSRVERVARALGMRVVLNDPPLARATGDPKYRPLSELADCDYIALHVPLTREGEDATYHLIDEERFDSACGEGKVVINACRGGVVNESWLAELITLEKQMGYCDATEYILDAWEGEPSIDHTMLDRAMLGTPHIAGYSHDGKVNGTRMVYEAACRALGRPIENIKAQMPPPAVERITIDAAGRRFDSVINEIILRAYPIDRDDADLRAAIQDNLVFVTAEENPDIKLCAKGDHYSAAFDTLRKHYPLRREFQATTVFISNLPTTWPADWAERIRAIGFSLSSRD